MLDVQPQNLGSIGLLAETSWEVCNKIGGIYTVLSTKARVLQERFGDKLVFIGPDVWSKENPSPFFKEDKKLFNGFYKHQIGIFDISVRTGRWKIPGSPQVILIKFSGVYEHLDEIFGKMWERFGVDSMHEYGDYREGCAFAVASALVIKGLADFTETRGANVTAHFNEWTTGMGLLYLQMIMPEAATIFTTHATSIGRSICGNGKPLYDYFEGYNGDQMAFELNMEAKHSLEKKAAMNADCFTAVSELTAKEAQQLLGIRPQVVTPNGFEPDFVPGDKKYSSLRKAGREKILSLAKLLKNKDFNEDALIVATSGRNEYRNKGLDMFLDSLSQLSLSSLPQDIIALILVPAWVSHPLELTDEKNKGNSDSGYITHMLHNIDSDSIASRIKTLKAENNIDNQINVIYIPCYLNGGDGVINISYYDLLPAVDLTIFASYYEPWGYTPLESIAFGIPTITSDKSGFGQWILDNLPDSLYESGVKVISRTDSNYYEAVREISSQVEKYAVSSEEVRKEVMKLSKSTAEKADWKYFILYYYQAFATAEQRRNQRINKY
ncbi:MAG: glycosyltransferase [Muribaculaceae bacterium]|nr:glycosyltransferase [Muribaculaceae bacterium]